MHRGTIRIPEARTAEERAIAQTEQELRYLDTVFEELSRASTEEAQ